MPIKKNLLLIFFVFFSFASIAQKNIRCASCSKKVLYPKEKYSICGNHFYHKKCYIKKIKNNLQNDYTYIFCDSFNCNLRKELNENNIIGKKNNIIYEDLKSRTCRDCNTIISSIYDKYIFCNKTKNCISRWLCEDCFTEQLSFAVDNNYIFLKCIECDNIVDLNSAKNTNKEINENIITMKNRANCNICFDNFYDIQESPIFYCPEHFSCRQCFFAYIKTSVQERKIPINCYAVDCEKSISLDFIEKLLPDQYEKVIECYEEMAPENIKEQRIKNQELLSRLIKTYNSQFTQCTHCFMVVERIAGCNHMHCTYCETDFDFLTGKEYFLQKFV